MQIRFSISTLLNRSDVVSNEDKLREFSKIYEAEFPDEDEREPLEIILDRVRGVRRAVDPHTFVLIVFDEHHDEVIGGGVGDCYPKSQCIHLTYLFIGSKYRNRGAWTALRKSVGNTIYVLEELHSVKFGHIFFEANIPEKTVMDSFDPTSRLKIFSRLNARIVDLPYIQPALSKELKKVSNLYLLCIPIKDKTSLWISKDTVVGFLFQLYQSLDINHPEDDSSFRFMLSYINNRPDPEHIPLLKISDRFHLGLY